MHCKFVAQPSGGIRLIPEIADYELCRLEGRNGIGKTLAVRLLDLATGGRPYVNAPAAWRSLKQQLGPVAITITGLHDGAALELRLNPDIWPDDPPSSPEVLGTALLNGEEIDFLTVGDVLRVIRIGGDEDIIKEFRDVIAADAALLSRFNGYLSQEIDRLDEACERLLRDTTGLAPELLSELTSAEARAEASRTETAQEFERQRVIVERLELLQRRVAALEDLEREGPDIDRDLAAIEVSIDDLVRQEKDLEERQRQLLPNAEREQRLAAEQDRLRREREEQDAAVREAETRARGACETLSLPMDAAAVREAEALTKSARATLLQHKALLIAPPDLTALIRRLLPPLDVVRGSALDEERLATIGGKIITVGELREGLQRRETEVSEQQQDSVIEEINLRIAKEETRLRDLRMATRLLSAAQQAKGRLNKVETELRSIVDELSKDRDDAYQQILQEIEQVQRDILDLFGRRAELRYKRGILTREGTVDVLSRAIDELRADLNVPSPTDEALIEAQAKMMACRVQLQTADEGYRRAVVARSNFEHKLDEVVALLERGSGYEWLRSVLSEWLPSVRDDRAQSLQRIASLDRAVRRFQTQMSAIVTEVVPSIYGALRDLVQSDGEVDLTLNRYLPPLVDYYEGRFRELLADPEIQEALFDGGSFSRLDLQHWEISWETKDGEPQRRPITAFSSGERAFAYVLASILRHGKEPARNRLLVLDEFGAFLEAGRLHRLAKFLHDRVLDGNRADQILIILPLRGVSDLASSDGDWRASAVMENGYYMEEIPRGDNA
jgi:hypothetical protein